MTDIKISCTFIYLLMKDVANWSSLKTAIVRASRVDTVVNIKKVRNTTTKQDDILAITVECMRINVKGCQSSYEFIQQAQIEAISKFADIEPVVVCSKMLGPYTPLI